MGHSNDIYGKADTWLITLFSDRIETQSNTQPIHYMETSERENNKSHFPFLIQEQF